MNMSPTVLAPRFNRYQGCLGLHISRLYLGANTLETTSKPWGACQVFGSFLLGFLEIDERGPPADWLTGSSVWPIDRTTDMPSMP